MKKKALPRKLLSKKKPEKRLTEPLKKRAGRNVSGKITVRHRGGGVKRLYRVVDFGEEKIGKKGRVVALEYDPNRTAFLALIEYEDKEKRYRLAPIGLRENDEIFCDEKTKPKIGNRMRLKNIPVGTSVFNIELEPHQGGKMVRSAGTSALIIVHEGRYTHLKMPSGEIRKILTDCFATVGQVSNPQKRFEKLGKAGRKRLMGWRPTVRGTAMNPIDHPHGGGSGKSPIGMKNPKTPWGKVAMGKKTRRKKWTDKLIIKRKKK